MKRQPQPDPGNIEHVARRIASRHMEIPPTPRDTLAVLRHAAESQQKARSPMWPAMAIRGLLAAVACMAVAFAVWQYTAPDVADSTTAGTELNADPGIDLADWDLEFDAIYDDLNQSLAEAMPEENAL